MSDHFRCTNLIRLHMHHKMPWQVLAGIIVVYWIAYAVSLIFAVACIWLQWPYIGAVSLLFSFAILAFAIPLNLNLDRHLFPHILICHLIHQLATVLIYAGYFAMGGLRDTGGIVSESFSDALYFSLATWTTLGAGDLMPSTALRLLVTIEALTAVLFLPVFAALFWMFLQEATVSPSETHLAKWQHRTSSNRMLNKK